MTKLCKNCGIENKDESNFCKNCGLSLNNEITQTQHIKTQNGTSIAGFVCSIFGIFTCGISSIIGLVLSIMGLSESKKNKQKDGLAIAGIIISSLYILIVIAVIIMVLALLYAIQ